MMKITPQRLHELFTVDIHNGRLFWKNPPWNHPRLKGMEAGCPRKGESGKEYWIIKIDKCSHYRGHLIFLAHHGRYPKPLADHRDGDSLNDRSSNLRDATILQNAWNHKTRRRKIALPMGVRFTAAGNFQARIGYRGTQIHLGAYDTAAKAEAAYRAKRQELFGEFA